MMKWPFLRNVYIMYAKVAVVSRLDVKELSTKLPAGRMGVSGLSETGELGAKELAPLERFLGFVGGEWSTALV